LYWNTGKSTNQHPRYQFALGDNTAGGGWRKFPKRRSRPDHFNNQKGIRHPSASTVLFSGLSIVFVLF
jgi:hypothetical protein